MAYNRDMKKYEAKKELIDFIEKTYNKTGEIEDFLFKMNAIVGEINKIAKKVYETKTN